MKQLWILLLVLTINAAGAHGQAPELINKPEFRVDAKAAVDSMYNFQFRGAEKAVAKWKRQYPDDPVWMLLSGIEYWWKVLSDLEDKSHDQKFYRMMKKTNYQAGKLLQKDSKNVDGLLVKTIANGYLARQYSNRDEWLKSLRYGRKAMNAYGYLIKLQPNLEDLKLAEGLKLYYTAYLPEEYPIVKTVSWAMPSGNKKKGLKLIKEASEQAVFARAGATYFLANINFNYEGDTDTAVKNFEKLVDRYPRNNYYARLLAKAYYYNNQREKDLEFINKTLQHWDNKQLPYYNVIKEELLAWKGRILSGKGADNKALACFKQSFEASSELPNNKSRPFYVQSAYWAGKLLKKMDKPKQATYYLDKATVAKTGSAYRDKAKQLLANIE